jgi:hypothetical protein
MKIRITYSILIDKPEIKNSLESLELRCGDNIKMDLRCGDNIKTDFVRSVNWVYLAHNRVK